MKYSEADHFREIAGINVPDNIAVFLNRFHSAIEISISNTDVENGYGQRIEKRLVIKMPYKRCVNCGYHSLWNPDDTESKCRRHTYAKGWDTVFCYNPATDGNLEQSFQNWLEDNENKVMIGERKSIWLKSGIQYITVCV